MDLTVLHIEEAGLQQPSFQESPNNVYEYAGLLQRRLELA